MGISVSSTQTHERLLQKRAIRKMKRYQQFDPTRQNASPTVISIHNENKQTPAPQTHRMHEINNFENLEITLKTNPKKYGDYQKMSSPRQQATSLLGKKDQMRSETSAQINHLLTIKNNNEERNHVSGQSSMQEIELAPNKMVNQLHINPINTTSFKTINSNNLAMSASQRNISLQNDPHPNEQSEEMSKEIEKKKIEQTKRYIETSAYPHKGTLSNAIYQNKSNTKIQTILSDGNYSLNKAPKTVVENRQIPEVGTIKLKTDEDYIDEGKSNSKVYKPTGPLLKNNSGKIVGNSSLSVNKKKSLV